MNDVSPNSALSLKKTSSIQSAHKEQSSHPVAHKEQSSIQSAHKKQFSHTVAHKGQFNIQFTYKKQFSHTVAHKGQSSIQSACQKQFNHFVIHQKQSTLVQAEQPSNSVILKESFNIPATSEKPFSLVSPIMKLDTSNHIAQDIQRKYQSKIKYQNFSFLQINYRLFMQFNVAELRT